MGIERAALLQSGERLVQAGILDNPTDIFSLHLEEMRALGEGQERDWKSLVAERRAVYRRELPKFIIIRSRACY